MVNVGSKYASPFNLFGVDSYTFLFIWRFDPIPGHGLLIGYTTVGKTPLDKR